MERLKQLFGKTYGETAAEITSIKGAGSGSDRRIYRLKNAHRSVVGIIGNNPGENRAFVEFSRHFRRRGLRVPEVYAENLAEGVYLEEDLGDDTLFIWASRVRAAEGFCDRIKDTYRSVIRYLPKFQIEVGPSLDFSYCYQHAEFGAESMLWDLHYFHNQFIANFYKGSVSAARLERDFNALVSFLTDEPCDYFLYRDFQSRNVMLVNGEPHFIDYQSGRWGPLQYDLAAILYDAKANLPEDFRREVIDDYLDAARQYADLDPVRFKKYFDGYVLIRIMQACGAYGFLGITKGKPQFLQSVPFAMRNLQIMLDRRDQTILSDLPALASIFDELTQDPSLYKL